MKEMKRELLNIILKENKKQAKDEHISTTSKVFIVLGLATAIITTALCVYSYLENRAYRKKWEEYDDCGI